MFEQNLNEQGSNTASFSQEDTRFLTKVEELLPNDPEVKAVEVHMAETTDKVSLLDRVDRFSDWSRATKAIAVVLRAITYNENNQRQNTTGEHDIPG